MGRTEREDESGLSFFVGIRNGFLFMAALIMAVFLIGCPARTPGFPAGDGLWFTEVKISPQH